MGQTHWLKAGLMLGVIGLVGACTGPKINPPGPAVETLFVIPVETDIKVISPRYGFYYVYEIIRDGDKSSAYQVDIEFPVAEDIVLVDSLAPGDYLLRKLIIRPRGSGDKTIGNSETYRYDRFRLESGKITIFSQSLKLTMRNQDPGRVGTILSRIDLVPVKAGRRNEILETLKKIPNFEAWEISTAP